MPPAYEVLLLNTAVPQIQAAQAGDTYVVPRDIAFSAVANLANGTYLLPALAFSSDPDTGIFRQGANQLGFTAGGGTDQMVLTSTGLGIGTSSPGEKLDVFGGSLFVGSHYVATTNTDYKIQLRSVGPATNNNYTATISLSGGTAQPADTSLVFSTQNWNGSAYVVGEKMRLDNSGNLGLGVTPSAWGGTYKGFQIGQGGLMSRTGGSDVYLLGNNYYDGTNFRYINTSFASRYQQDGGAHAWFTAPSGTAGNTISFTQAMTLNASGYLGIGETNPIYNVHVSGTNTVNNRTFSTSATGDALVAAQNNNGKLAGSLVYGSTKTAYGALLSDETAFYSNTSTTIMADGSGSAIKFAAGGNTERARITSGGDLLVGDTSTFSAYAKVHALNGVAMATNSTNGGALIGATTTGTELAYLSMGRSYNIAATGEIALATTGAKAILFGTNNTERARITSGGNFKIGGSADRATTEGDKQLVLFDGTAPVGTLANGVSFYSASGEANVMDAAGNATLLSPHDAETNEWIFRSKHTPTGKVLKIDVERLLKFVNDHFGLGAVHEFIED